MEKRETFRIVWDGDSQADCVEVCQDLQRAGIEYTVNQQPLSRSISMRVNWRFRVAVPDSDYEAARGALGLSATAAAELEDEAVEIPESSGPISDSSLAGEERRAGSYLKGWHPEDATVEIWEQANIDAPTIVELALKENLIHYRLQRADDGTCRLFVLPDDELRAREIVHEIEKGEPPD